MHYVLTQNKQILLGPIFWRHRQIQSELNDQEVEFSVSPVEPNSYVKINDEFEIFPVTGLEIPNHEPMYQQLAGPFWTFTDVANGTYTVVDREIPAIKNDLKALTASERYKKEVAGTKITLQNQEVSVDTSRDGRNVFIQKYSIMSDTDTVQWKFPECWLTLTKSELGQVVTVGANHIESQFIWEQEIVIQIDAAQTIDELKSIVIIEPLVNGVL